MRLALKMIAAALLVILLVMGLQMRSRIAREADLFQSDMRRDHLVLARGLSLAVGSTWDEEGREKALDLVVRANKRVQPVEIRWVWLGGHGGEAYDPAAPAEALAPLLGGKESVGWVDTRTPDGGKLYTYFTLPIEGEAALGGFELSESLSQQRAYVRYSIQRLFVYAILLSSLATVALAGLSVFFVGRPAALLIDQARRVGRGDLGQRLALDQEDELGEVARAMNTMTDQLQEAQARAAAEASAREAAQLQLRHADRLMTVGKLASGLAHELGTPLNVVGVRGLMIARGEAVGAEAAESGQIIWEQVGRMTQIIRQLLDFARPRPPTRAPEDVRGLVTRAFDLLEPMARKRGVSLTLTAPEERQAVSVTASVDGGQILQVLTNIVVNGIHAMKEGGSLRAAVAVSATPPPPDVPASPGPWVCIEMRDDGAGVAPEHLERLFEPFFTTKEIGEGTGLGLSVAWGIVREHGGWISVESRQGEGATFRIYLPVGEGV